MTQPPLTQAIAQLERSLGVMPFARTKRSVQLTPQGWALLPQAQALLQQAKAVVLDARALAAGESGRLRLAGLAAQQSCPSALSGFCQRAQCHPC